jgi:putative hemolysin
MSAIAYQVIIIFLLLIANGLFALSEMAVVSARKARLHTLAEDGSRRASVALALANDPSRFLSTVQTGVTLVGILAGAYGGANIASNIAPYFKHVAWLAPHADSIALGVVVTLITYFTLIIGELVPKHIALNHPEAIACYVAAPMGWISRMAGPVVSFLTLSTEFVLRILHIRKPAEVPVTEDEIRVLIDQGTQAGMFHEAEQDIVDRVFRFADRRVSSLMTHRTEVDWLDIDDPPAENKRKILESTHSRFVVCRGDFDDVVGIVQLRDLLAQQLEGRPFDLKPVLRDPVFIPETVYALKALEMFRMSGTKMGLVIDEYGTIHGLVTLADMMEAIVGTVTETAEEPEVVQRPDGSWLLDGMLSTDELREVVPLGDLPEGDFHTLAGFIINQLGDIPKAGDAFDWEGFRFEVIDMDDHRIDKVLVSPLPPETPEAGEQREVE